MTTLVHQTVRPVRSRWLRRAVVEVTIEWFDLEEPERDGLVRFRRRRRRGDLLAGTHPVLRAPRQAGVGSGV